MTASPRIVVLGGHGKIALLAAPKLRAAGCDVEAVIRNPDHAADVERTGATPVVLDIESADVEAMAELFSGADAVLFSAGAGGGNPVRTNAVDFEAAVRAMTAAERAAVRRFVMVSYARAGVDIDSLDPSSSFFPYAKAKHAADEHLRGTGLDYTILGPGKLTLEASRGRVRIVDGDGAIDGRAPEEGETDTARETVADVIAHVIASGTAVRSTVNFYDGETPIAEAIP